MLSAMLAFPTIHSISETMAAIGSNKRKKTSPPATTPPGTVSISTTSSNKKAVKATNPRATTSTITPLPPSRIDAGQASKAVQALMQHYAKHQAAVASKKGGKQDLLASEAGDYILVQVALAKIPERVSPKPVPIRLPHPLHGSGKDDEEEHAVCLIVKEDDKAKVKKALAVMKMEGVSEVVGLQELRTDYREFQERRKLRDAFDLFLVDDRILPLLGKALGKTFFSKKKHPISLKIGGLLSSNPSSMATVGKRIIAAQQRTHLYRNHGNCLAIKVAKTSFPPSFVLANVLAGIEGAVEALPGKWKNVMAISLKTSASVALPLYQRLPQYLVKKPVEPQEAVMQQLKEKEEEEEKEMKKRMKMMKEGAAARGAAAAAAGKGKKRAGGGEVVVRTEKQNKGKEIAEVSAAKSTTTSSSNNNSNKKAKTAGAAKPAAAKEEAAAAAEAAEAAALGAGKKKRPRDEGASAAAAAAESTTAATVSGSSNKKSAIGAVTGDKKKGAMDAAAKRGKQPAAEGGEKTSQKKQKRGKAKA